MGQHRARHRVPPKPHHMLHAKPGRCKFCGDPIYSQPGKINKRATWHPQCSLRWSIMNNPQQARRFVFVRDRGICAACGTNCAPGDEATVRKIIERIMAPPETGMILDTLPLPLGEWELDHTKPLSKAGDDLSCWQLGNMQTLCPPCHSAKTKADRLLYA